MALFQPNFTHKHTHTHVLNKDTHVVKFGWKSAIGCRNFGKKSI